MSRLLDPSLANELVQEYDGIRGAERNSPFSYGTIHRALAEYKDGFTYNPTTKPHKIPAPKTGVNRYIFTSAQDGTKPHSKFLDNLKAYAKHHNAELIIAPFTYNKSLFSDHETAGSHYHHELTPYIQHGRIHLADKIALCCEMNTLPTKVNPLSGLQSYTGELWGIFPHPKIRVETVAQPKKTGAKINYTTGSVTLPNYIKKTAGLKAEFHHVLGAVIIEITPDKKFIRHILADEKDGSFYDLDILVKDKKVSRRQNVEAIVWPDIHYEKTNHDNLETCFFKKGSILDTLKPKHQFFHDLTDFQSRNHHNINDTQHLYTMYREGKESISVEVSRCVEFLKKTKRPWCKSVVVESNHDQALLRWLKSDKGRTDPPNMRLWHLLNVEMLNAVDEEAYFNAFARACKISGAPDEINFLNEDDSYQVDGVECAFHSHRGPNGSRGSITNYAKMGCKTNIGHGHGGGVYDGCYQSGAMALEMGYNKGPSGWTVTPTIQYPNGKRTLLTLDKGEWRA